MNKIKERFEGGRFSQTVNLLLTNFLGLPLSIGISILLVKMLGAEGFGDYSFINSIFIFSVLIFTIGIFHSGGRALVLNKSEIEGRKYYGVELILLVIIFFLMSAVLILYSFFDNNLNTKGLSEIFLMVLPVGIIFLFNNFIDILLQADNKIKAISFYRFFSKLFHLILLVSVYFISYNKKFNVDIVFLFYIFFLSYLFIFYFIAKYLNPIFVNTENNLKSIIFHNKEYGFNIYIGGLVAVGFVSLSPILIGYFSDNNDDVGFFMLALTFCAPITLIPNTVATVFYRDFYKNKKIDLYLVLFTWIVGFVSVLILILITEFLILRFYGADFFKVISLIYIMAFGFLIHGIGDFYNKFLSANGESIKIRNNSFFVGFISIFLGIILIYSYGVYGAAYSRVLVGVVYLLTVYRCYVSCLK